MAQLKLNKINFIDLSVVAIVILIVAVGAGYYLNKPRVESTRLRATVEISDPSQVKALKDIVTKPGTVYLNSNNSPMEATGMVSADNLLVTVSGPGHMSGDGLYYFNGQRLLVGQKAEIHASYFAQGKIIKIENAN